MTKHSNITLVDTTTLPHQWNEFVSHPLQTWEWGEVRASQGLRVIRFQEKTSTGMNHFQLTIHPIPKTPFTIGYLPKSSVPSREVLGFMKEIATEHSCAFIKFEPVKQKHYLTNEEKKVLALCKKSPHPLFPQWTQILDLNQPEETLLSTMKSKTRYNIRLGEKNGVVVKEMTSDEGFEIFQKLYFETCRRQKYHGHTYKYHQQIYSALKDNVVHILVAFYKDIPLAAYELFLFHDQLYYPYGGSSDRERNKMAANVIMWEAIRFGKKMNATSFDMWGSLDPDYSDDNPWAGFTRFKQGYGASFVELAGSYDCVYMPVIYSLYGTAQKLRSYLLHT